MILFPTLEEALDLHQKLIENFGGDSGVRDRGLLESALYRPQTGYYDDLLHMAAALMESMLVNHAFVDGNKRMAFFLTDIFLRLNGFKIKTGSASGHRFILHMLSQKEFRFAAIVQWLKKSVVKI